MPAKVSLPEPPVACAPERGYEIQRHRRQRMSLPGRNAAQRHVLPHQLRANRQRTVERRFRQLRSWSSLQTMPATELPPTSSVPS